MMLISLLTQAVVEYSLRFGMGARIWLGEICERDGVDRTAAQGIRS
jgi:phosphoribosylformylglycinamidine synthase